MNILIVEDNPADTALLKKSLSTAYPDAVITCVETGRDALDKINNNEYACIFLDCDLPDLSGIDILRHIYMPQTDLPPYPCVMVTGLNNQELFMDAMFLGAQDYIQKTQVTPEVMFLVCEKARYLFNLKSEKNEITKKYNHTQKIKAIGQLTGGIAHDFNNLLTVILGNTQLVLDDAQNDRLDRDYTLKKMESINRAAQKGSDLVKNLMSFARQRELKPEPINLNDVINDIEYFMTCTVGKTITIDFDFSPELWNAHVDLSELEHLIINLCANARDAMPNGGNFTVSTRNVNSKETSIIGLNDGEYVHFSVTDTGIGIEEEHLDKIFDPFFTTKDVGKGTGLGMSTAYTFVESCGGTINVKSKPNEGTTFDIYFPKCTSDSKTNENKTNTVPPKKITDGGVVLVTEDEKEIRDLAVLILRNFGFETIEAKNGKEALHIIKDESVHIDLLFTDIVMPGEINGVQLAARARVLRPDLNILFTTGYIRDHIPDINFLEDYEVLNKPYLPDEMIVFIQRTLGKEANDS